MQYRTPSFVANKNQGLYMKTIRLLLLFVWVGTAFTASAQSYLPQKSAFSIGGGPMWGIIEGKGNFNDMAGSPMCGNFGAEYRYYPIPNIGLGVAYNHLWGSKDNKSMACNYVAPTFTARWLWAENKRGFWLTAGVGYFGYKDDLAYLDSYKKGYLGASFSLGYEFSIGEGVGLQLRADCISADFKYEGYHHHHNHNDYNNNWDNWDSSMGYLSLGIALVFGK